MTDTPAVDLRTPEEWERSGWASRRVVDPDGWRCDGKPWDAPISWYEYQRRSAPSTTALIVACGAPCEDDPSVTCSLPTGHLVPIALWSYDEQKYEVWDHANQPKGVSWNVTPACSCGTPGLDYEGPQRDCPIHGEEPEETCGAMWDAAFDVVPCVLPKSVHIRHRAANGVEWTETDEQFRERTGIPPFAGTPRREAPEARAAREREINRSLQASRDRVDARAREDFKARLIAAFENAHRMLLDPDPNPVTTGYVEKQQDPWDGNVPPPGPDPWTGPAKCCCDYVGGDSARRCVDCVMGAHDRCVDGTAWDERIDDLTGNGSDVYLTGAWPFHPRCDVDTHEENPQPTSTGEVFRLPLDPPLVKRDSAYRRLAEAILGKPDTGHGDDRIPGRAGGLDDDVAPGKPWTFLADERLILDVPRPEPLTEERLQKKIEGELLHGVITGRWTGEDPNPVTTAYVEAQNTPTPPPTGRVADAEATRAHEAVEGVLSSTERFRADVEAGRVRAIRKTDSGTPVYRIPANPKTLWDMPVIEDPLIPPGQVRIVPSYYIPVSRELLTEINPRIEFGFEEGVMVATINGKRIVPGVVCHYCDDTGEIVTFEGRGGPDPQPPESEPCFECMAAYRNGWLDGLVDLDGFIEHLDGDTVVRGED